MLTQAWLQHLLHYDPLTGYWTWMNPLSTRVRRGDPAGSTQTKGYRYIKIAGTSYIAARLAFLYMTGAWPEDEVDHENRIQWDDRWDNLKDSTRTGNNLNRVIIGPSGYPGVRKHSYNESWTASYKNIYIGSYKTCDEAVAARDAFMESIDAVPTVSDSERNAS